MKRRVFHVEQASRLEAVLRRELELDHDGATELVNRGAVYLDGKRAKDASTRVGPGNKVMVVLEEGGVAVTEAPPPGRG